MATRIVPNAVEPSIQQLRRRTAKLPVKLRLKAPTKLNSKYPIHRLPFVCKAELGLNFWTFPVVAGYGPGCQLGAAAAQAYLKAFKASPHGGGWLQHLVLDAVAAGAGPNYDEGRRGIIVGFFSQLDQWLQVAVSFSGTHFDRLEYAKLEYEMSSAASRSADDYNRMLTERMSLSESNDSDAEAEA